MKNGIDPTEQEKAEVTSAYSRRVELNRRGTRSARLQVLEEMKDNYCTVVVVVPSELSLNLT
jgi:hypothetical protein